MKINYLIASVTCLFIGFLSGSVHAQTISPMLEGTRTITAVFRDGHQVPIGTVTFSSQANNVVGFNVVMDYSTFTDYFLSMKEFKCLEGEEVSCHVAYPYKNPQTITQGDLSWLEHSLLFLYKKPREFGAKLWNGTYYAFKPTSKGLIGYAQAVDLNYISAPSNTPNIPPYAADKRVDTPNARSVDHLLIE